MTSLPLEQYKGNPSSDVILFEPRPAIQWKSDLQSNRTIANRDFRGQNPQGGTAINVWAKADVSGAKAGVPCKGTRWSA